MPDRANSPGHPIFSGCSGFYFLKQLSRRELQTLELAAYGYTDDEIARQMNVVTRTVRVYWCRARQKLRANNRTNAVAIALTMGWIKVDILRAIEVREVDPAG